MIRWIIRDNWECYEFKHIDTVITYIMNEANQISDRDKSPSVCPGDITFDDNDKRVQQVETLFYSEINTWYVIPEELKTMSDSELHCLFMTVFVKLLDKDPTCFHGLGNFKFQELLTQIKSQSYSHAH